MQTWRISRTFVWLAVMGALMAAGCGGGDAGSDFPRAACPEDSEPAGPGELRNCGSTTIGPITVSASPEALARPVVMTAEVVPMPAPLPEGVMPAGDTVDIAVDDPGAIDAPLEITIAYDPAMMQPDRIPVVLHYDEAGGYQPSPIVAHDADRHTLTFLGRAFSPHTIGQILASPPATHAIPGFLPSRDGWSIPNEGGPLFTQGGNCLGMSAFAAWYWSHPGRAENPLATRFPNNDVTRLLAMRAQLAMIPLWLALKSPHSQASSADTITRLKANLAAFNAPFVLIVNGHGHYNSRSAVVRDASHALIVYGYDEAFFHGYDPNLPGVTVRIPYTASGFSGQVLDPSGTPVMGVGAPAAFWVYSVPALGSHDDFNTLLTEASGNFSASAALTIDTPVEGEVLGSRILTVAGAFTSALPEESAVVVVSGGLQFPLVVRPDRTFSGMVPAFAGSAPVYVIASPGLDRGSVWHHNSAVRRINVSTEAPPAELVTFMSWVAAPSTDLDLYLVAPDGRAVWWNGFGSDVGTLYIDNTSGTGPEYISVSSPSGHVVQTGPYIVRVHFFRDGRPPETVGTNVGVTVSMMVREGNGPSLRRCRFYMRYASSDAAQSDPSAFGPDWVDVAAVDPTTGTISPASSNVDCN